MNREYPYYEYEPKVITEEGDYKVYGDRTIRTDKEEIHNKPDIIVYNKMKKKVRLIDIAIPLSANMKNTYNEKKRKQCCQVLEVKRPYSAL